MLYRDGIKKLINDGATQILSQLNKKDILLVEILLYISIIFTLGHANVLAFLVYKQWHSERVDNQTYLLNNHPPAELLYPEGVH